MKLTEEKQKIALKRLKGFFNKRCGCRNPRWILNDTIFELREFQGGGLKIGGQSAVFPVITVSCKQCGNTEFFNAILLGLVEKKDGSEK